MIYSHQTKPRMWSPTIEVVSCICWYNDTFLCLLREKSKREGNKWGFPAGKVLEGENKEKALKREFQEELNLTLPETTFLKEFFVRYPKIDFCFNVFEATFGDIPEIKISTAENSRYEWMTPREFLSSPVVNGNAEILEALYPKALAV